MRSIDSTRIPHRARCLAKLAIGWAVLLTFACNVYADDQENGEVAQGADSRLEMKTDRVIVFKDGYCLIVKQAIATTDADGVVFTDEVPDAAALGSFWMVPEQGTLKSTVAGWVETSKETKDEVNVTSIIEVVQSNLGNNCSFKFGDEKVEGTLLKILANDAPNTISDALLHHSMVTTNAVAPRVTVTRSAVKGQFFLVRTAVGDKIIPVNSVTHLTIENMNSSMEQTVTTKAKHKRLSMTFAEANTKVKLNVMYFRPDVRWIPTYRVNLTDELVAAAKDADEKAPLQKKADLMLQGELLNEAEDFSDVPIHVVVGVPNFRFRSVPSPMVLEGAIRNVLAQAAPNIMGNGFNNMSNSLYTQRSGEMRSNRAAGNGARNTVDLPAELSGSGGNDLFVYELPPMDLKKGERAMVPILQTTVPYRDIYTWDVELTHSETFAATSADSPSPLLLSESKVWRQVELINNTDLPWTTGAVMLVDQLQPLAQELLTYTSPGGICRVPVTVSVDLRGKVTDTEVKRTLGAFTWRSSKYARIEGEIEAELANNKTHAVPVEVRVRFGGKATKVSDDGKITLESYRKEDWSGHRGDVINNSSRIQWKATVGPGECFKPMVNYEFLLRY